MHELPGGRVVLEPTEWVMLSHILKTSKVLLEAAAIPIDAYNAQALIASGARMNALLSELARWTQGFESITATPES
jgi:hypothetical protein